MIRDTLKYRQPLRHYYVAADVASTIVKAENPYVAATAAYPTLLAMLVVRPVLISNVRVATDQEIKQHNERRALTRRRRREWRRVACVASILFLLVGTCFAKPPMTPARREMIRQHKLAGRYATINLYAQMDAANSAYYNALTARAYQQSMYNFYYGPQAVYGGGGYGYNNYGYGNYNNNYYGGTTAVPNRWYNNSYVPNSYYYGNGYTGRYQ